MLILGSYRRRNLVTQELTETKDRFHHILYHIDAAIWSYDIVTNQTVVSAGLLKFYDYSREEFLHNPELWLKAVHPEDMLIATGQIEKLHAGNMSTIEHRILKQSGEVRWMQCIGTPVKDRRGNVVLINGVIVDITEQKKAEEALQRSEQRYKSLFEYNTDVICEFDLQGNPVAISPKAASIIGEDPMDANGGLSFMDILGSDGSIGIKDYVSFSDQDKPRSFEFTSRNHKGRVLHWDIKIIPIVINCEITGLFAICNDITSRKCLEQALAEREAMYRLVAENMTDMMGVSDIYGTLHHASPSVSRVLGIDNHTMKGTNLFHYIHPEDRGDMRRCFDEILQSKANRQVRIRIAHADGYSIFFDCMGTPVIGDDGDVESVIVVGREVTKQVIMEKELKESEERYRRLIELSPQPISSHRNGRFIYVNPAGLRLLGAKDKSEVIGKNMLDIVKPQDWDRVRRRAREVMEQEYISSVEYQLVCLDGREIDAEVSGIYDWLTDSALSVIQDITERKKMERILKESEEHYRRLVEQSTIAIAVLKGPLVDYVNPAGLKVAGVDCPEDIIGTKALDWIHPDDREEAIERIEKTTSTGFGASGEARLIRRDGKTVEVAVTSIYDSGSGSVELLVEDISVRKVVERALLESEELNRHLVELSPIAIILHSDYKFRYVNPSGIALFGAARLDDLVGRSIFDFLEPEYQEKVAIRLNSVYARAGTSNLVEQRNLRVDGSIIEVEAIATPIPYMGKNAGLTLIRDITDRKKAEAERLNAEQMLRESEERYLRLQTSLDRFSDDLFGIMKIRELDSMFVKEVKSVLQAPHVNMIEVDHNRRAAVKCGDPIIQDDVRLELNTRNLSQLPICEIIDMANGYLVKVGEHNGKNMLLCIGDKAPAMSILAKRVWLETLTRYVSVLYDNFRLIEDLTRELEHMSTLQVTPSWLLRLLFNLSENERKRLSQDLHDAALQEQIVWYRKLDQLASGDNVPPELAAHLQQVAQGMLDVIYHIRITCNELRPPMLMQEGLVSSLEALFEFTQLRSNYAVMFHAKQFNHHLSADILIGLYRIVQELLANATKHSNATQVQITLSSQPDHVTLNYSDNGIGMNIDAMENTFGSMGVYGIKERVRSMDGKVEFHSVLNQGLSLYIAIPAASALSTT
jgi:PAS domain S-box-containing protein